MHHRGKEQVSLQEHGKLADSADIQLFIRFYDAGKHLQGLFVKDQLHIAAAYDRTTDTATYAIAEKMDGFYHGTGDTFASALVAALAKDMTVAEATEIAVEYTLACIKRTYAEGTDTRFGVDIENELPTLMRLLHII